jgi:hypothetical protein
MADLSPVLIAAQRTAELKSLELLFDYTKFHIGVYLTLTATYITLATSKVGEILPKLNPCAAGFAVICFLIAGIAGGMIGSHIPECDCASATAFMGQSLDVWWFVTFPARRWAAIEHNAFWVGIIAALLSFTKIPTLIGQLLNRPRFTKNAAATNSDVGSD